jgi:hypothetical protein
MFIRRIFALREFLNIIREKLDLLTARSLIDQCIESSSFHRLYSWWPETWQYLCIKEQIIFQKLGIRIYFNRSRLSILILGSTKFKEKCIRLLDACKWQKIYWELYVCIISIIDRIKTSTAARFGITNLFSFLLLTWQ